MDCELPNDDSRTKGASWVHGAASEVDLGNKYRAVCEKAWPPKHERLRERLLWPTGPPTFPREGPVVCMYTVLPLCLTPMRWPNATEVPIMAAGEPNV